MKLYKKLTVFVVTLILTHNLFANEGGVYGSLYDENDVSIPFATVAVMKLSDSTVVTGSTTDMDGLFKIHNLKKGRYFLKFSSVGYQTKYSTDFHVKDIAFTKDFGKTILPESLAMLDEVMIQVWRPQVKVEPDKMVVNVDGTPLAAGSSAYDALSRSPGVSVSQDGEFQLNGKTGVSIMIDGKQTYLSSQDLQTLLKGMSAENIKDIELIHNPSSKYDAEGTAGILNINLKKNSTGGFNGSSYAGYRYNQQHYYNAGVNLNYKKGKWNSFFSLDIAEDGKVRNQEMKRIFNTEDPSAILEQTGRQETRKFTPSLRLGSDYQIDTNHQVGFMANLSYQKSSGNWNNSGFLQNFETDESLFIDAKNQLNEEFGNGRMNVHYEGKLDTLGTVLSADLDFIRLSKDTESRFKNRYTFSDGSLQNELLQSSSFSDYTIFSGRIDLNIPLSETSNLELGGKASKVVSESELRFFTEAEGVLIPDAERSSVFRYEEEIYAAYADFSSQLSPTWTLQAGIRAEQTVAEGKSASVENLAKRDYLEFFPNLRLSQQVSENYTVNYSYSRRITRPQYKRLNPFLFYLDPYTYVEGYPGLKPQFTNSFQVNQNFFKKYNLLLSYDMAQDFIIEVPFQDPETNETAFAIRNLDSYRNYSAAIMAPVKISSNWNMTNNLVLAQQEYSSVIDGQKVENKQFFYMVQSSQRVKFPLNISMEANATYTGPVAYGLYSLDARFGLDIGLKRSFMEDRLDVTLKTTDILKTMDISGVSTINGNAFLLDQYFGDRGVSINLRYNLSNEKSKTQNRQTDLEELNRAGGK
ncbi:outer membrane beta-barrel family protein [Planktosalinus lacus]|nr:outer membrane beta-barrel family protein [Planktosalinus lacus]